MGSRNFRERPENELHGLSDDDLIDYIRRARDSGAARAVRLALSILVYGHWDRLVARALLKIPRDEAEDVAALALEGAIRSAFDGESVGQFRSWLNTIVDRRVADYHRKPRLETTRIPDRDADDEWGEEPAADFEGDTIDAARAIELALGELGEDHRRVVEIYVLTGGSAREAAAAVEGMSEANVHQIGSRFRRRLRELLEGGAA